VTEEGQDGCVGAGVAGSRTARQACGWPQRSDLAGTSVPLATHRCTQPSAVAQPSGVAGLV